MARPLTHDGLEHREMTEAEYEAYRQLNDEVEAHQTAADQAAAARVSALSKLKALGLTDAEIAALVG